MMDPSIMVVAIVAMVLGYKLLIQLIHAFRPMEAGTSKRVVRAAKDQHLGELQARSEDLLRRLTTLEEIITTDRSERS